MKPIKTFIVGSTYFFSKYKDFISKDIDELNIVDKMIGDSNSLRFKLNNKDVFFYKNLSKEEFIKDTLDSKLFMKAGKFLVPEFCDWINFTIRDLSILKNCFDKIDKKHLYEKYIFDCYLKNNKFVLTEKQLDKAYKIYLNNKNYGNKY